MVISSAYLPHVGCVRLWNPLVAADDPSNGKPIATVNSDIASFSLGDRLKGEHQLVVYVPSLVFTILTHSLDAIASGDCAGEISIFDRFLDIDFLYT